MDPEPAERLPPVAIVVEGEAGGCLWCGSPAGDDGDAPAR
jgi:hypothetical protein